MSKRHLQETILAVALIAAVAATRLVPHPYNFSPLGALALFSGARLKGFWAFLIPLAALLLSDCILGFYPGMPLVYFGFTAIVVLGLVLRRSPHFFVIGATSLASSLIFFVVTNLGVWGFSGLYPVTLSGLYLCFMAAVPFFTRTVLSDLFFNSILFGAYFLLRQRTWRSERFSRSFF